MNVIRFLYKLVPYALALFVAGIFFDSLRYKFSNDPKTEVIFGKLNEWAGTLGLPGLFSHQGLFSQYVIGSAEFLAAALLVAGFHPRLRALQGLGALLALVIMIGAVSFHLFTPLGTDPNQDGGGLFVAACLVWLSSLVLVFLRRKELLQLVGR